MHQIKIDEEFKSLIPPLSAEERSQLEANLLADGCRDPLVVWGGHNVLIDGHNRFEICSRHGIEFKVEYKEFDTRSEATIWIVRNQFGRRNLDAFVRAQLALLVKPLIEAKAKAKQQCGQGGILLSQISDEATPVRTDDELARMAGVSRDTIRKVEKIIEQGSPELVEAIKTKEVSINLASDIASMDAEKQKAIVSSGKDILKTAVKEIRAQKTADRRAERVAKITEIAKGNAPLGVVAESYPVIYADPPWRYEHAESESRAIENQYPTMSLDEIKGLPVGDIASSDCVLFMWATSPKLAESLEVLSAWGFNYRTCAVWDKQKIGMGYYFRQQHELLLVAVKGNPPTPEPSARPSSVLSYPRGQHSAKPVEVYEVIEAMYPEFPKLEMFCRSPRNGWGVWGNQSGAA